MSHCLNGHGNLVVPPLYVHVGIIRLHLQAHLPELVLLSVTGGRLRGSRILMTRWADFDLISVDGDLLLYRLVRHGHLSGNLHLSGWKLLLPRLHVSKVLGVFRVPDCLLCHHRQISTARWVRQPCLACWGYLLLDLWLPRLSDLLVLLLEQVYDRDSLRLLVLSHIDVVLDIEAVLLPELLFYSPRRSKSFIVPLLDLKVIPDLLLLLRVHLERMILHTLTGQCATGAVRPEHDSLLGFQLCALQHAMLLQHWLQA